MKEGAGPNELNGSLSVGSRTFFHLCCGNEPNIPLAYASGYLSPTHSTAMDDPTKLQRWTWWFVGFGLIARSIQYLLCAPLWHDELALVDALLQVESFGELGRPLANAQIAPPLFLAVQWWLIHTFGCGEYVVRLVPFTASIASLLLFHKLCHRTMPPIVTFIAVGIFAVSGNLIEYAADAKPYAGDVASTLLILLLTHEWLESGKTRWLLLLTCSTPLIMAFSLPAMFLLGAVAIVGGLIAIKSDWSTRFAYAAYSSCLLSSFLVLLTTFLNRQSTGTLTFMDQFWEPSFFPWNAPADWPAWLVSAHTGQLMAYPIGGGNYASVLTTVAFVIGLFAMWRTSESRSRHLAICLLPFALCLIASAMHRYPYGYLNRTSVFLAPLVIIVAAVGTAAAGGFCMRRWRAAVHRPLIAYSILLLLIGSLTIVTALAKPSRARRDWQSRSFARWFWRDHGRSYPTICALTDLQLDMKYTVDYRCHQRRYSSPHKLGPRADIKKLLRPGTRLRIVFPQDPRYPSDQLAVWSEIEKKLGKAKVLNRQAFEVNPGDSLLCPVYHVVDVVIEPNALANLAGRETDTK